MPAPRPKYSSYSYLCEIGNQQISNCPILPIKCKGCGRQMCEDHRIKWGAFCKACWTTVPPETQQSLVAECKAISKARRIQFLKDLGKTFWLAPLWLAAYLWRKIKKRHEKGPVVSKPIQHSPSIVPNSDHPSI